MAQAAARGRHAGSGIRGICRESSSLSFPHMPTQLGERLLCGVDGADVAVVTVTLG